MKPMSAKGPKGKFKKKRAKKVEAPKACRFEKEGTYEIDYRDIETLHRHVTGQGKLQGRKRNGTSAFYQRQLTLAVKRARFLALLPFLGE
jgi:small subunit ribosomal protein S18